MKSYLQTCAWALMETTLCMNEFWFNWFNSPEMGQVNDNWGYRSQDIENYMMHPTVSFKP